MWRRFTLYGSTFFLSQTERRSARTLILVSQTAYKNLARQREWDAKDTYNRAATIES